MSLRDAVGGFAAVGVIFDITLNSLELMMLLADVLFIPFSIIWGTVLPHTDAVDQDSLQWLLLVLALFYVLHLLTKRWRKRRDDIMENAR